MNAEGVMWAAVALTCLGGAGVLVAFLVGPIGTALARRISGGGDARRLDEVERRVDELAERLGTGPLGDQLAEVHERLEFAERLLARAPLNHPPADAAEETTGAATPV